jgi:hypothetical protein
MNTDVLQQEIAPGVKLTLAGIEYLLTFPLKAVIAFKQKTGVSLFNFDQWKEIDPKINPDFFLTALWAAVHTKHPDVTEEQLAEVVDFSNAASIERALVETLKSYFPKPKDAEGEVDPNGQTPESK